MLRVIDAAASWSSTSAMTGTTVAGIFGLGLVGCEGGACTPSCASDSGWLSDISEDDCASVTSGLGAFGDPLVGGGSGDADPLLGGAGGSASLASPIHGWMLSPEDVEEMNELLGIGPKSLHQDLTDEEIEELLGIGPKSLHQVSIDEFDEEEWLNDILGICPKSLHQDSTDVDDEAGPVVESAGDEEQAEGFGKDSAPKVMWADIADSEVGDYDTEYEFMHELSWEGSPTKVLADDGSPATKQRKRTRRRGRRKEANRVQVMPAA